MDNNTEHLHVLHTCQYELPQHIQSGTSNDRSHSWKRMGIFSYETTVKDHLYGTFLAEAKKNFRVS